MVIRKINFLTLFPSTSNDDNGKVLYNDALFHNKQFSSFFLFPSLLRSVIVNKVIVYGTLNEEQVRLTLRKQYFFKGKSTFSWWF